MKTPEDDAFDELAKRQGAWGGGFTAKRQAAMDKINSEFHEEYIKYRTAFPKEYTAPQPAHCQCTACKDGILHASDCAVHNGPAYPAGPCDCGVAQQPERKALKLALDGITKVPTLTHGLLVKLADVEAVIDKALAQPAQKIPYPVTGWKVEVRGSNQRLFITGVYGDTIFVDLPEAQPAQEPVAEIVSDVNGFLSTRWNDNWTPNEGNKLYTHPPKREWAGLTDEEIKGLWASRVSWTNNNFARAVEHLLKEKNT